MSSNTAISSPLKPLFCETFKALDAEHIKIVLLRDDLNSLGDLTEFDLLISKRDSARTFKLLEKHGWLKRKIDILRGGKQVFYRYVNFSMHYLDLHYEVVQGGLKYMDADLVLKNSHYYNDGLYIPCKEAWFIHVVFHVVLGKQSLAPKYVERINWFTSGKIDHLLLVELTKTFNLQDIMLDILESPVEMLSDPIQIRLLRDRTINKIKSHLSFFSIGSYRERVFKAFANLGHPGSGCSIAVIGVDGAGKSTFIKTLRGSLRDSGLKSREVYMGPWDRHLLPTTKFLSSIGANPRDLIKGTDASISPQVRIRKKTKGLIKRYVYYANSLVEIWCRYILKVLPHRIRGRIVLWDRHYYDLEIGYKNNEVKNCKVLRRILMNLGPKPTLIVCLTADPKKIVERKQEDPIHEVEWAVQAYSQLAARRNIPVIRTESDVQQVVQEFIYKNKDFIF